MRILFLTLLLTMIPASYVHAYKRAPFPNADSLQPIPDVAHPNISGNVNYSTDVTSSQEPSQIGTSPQADGQQLQDVSQSTPQGNNLTSPISPDPSRLFIYAAITSLLLAGILKLRKVAQTDMRR